MRTMLQNQVRDQEKKLPSLENTHPVLIKDVKQLTLKTIEEIVTQ